MEQYDIAQICLNGHIRNDGIYCHPEKSETYCSESGAETITQCPTCNANIQGSRIDTMWHGERYTHGLTYDPKHCKHCGKAYPWTESKIATAIQILMEFGNLDEEEKKTIEKDINNIAKDIPEAELSAMRLKRIWTKCKNAGYEVIMEFTSRTAAKILKEP